MGISLVKGESIGQWAVAGGVVRGKGDSLEEAFLSLYVCSNIWGNS